MEITQWVLENNPATCRLGSAGCYALSIYLFY
jgi:hypothetical protein